MRAQLCSMPLLVSPQEDPSPVLSLLQKAATLASTDIVTVVHTVLFVGASADVSVSQVRAVLGPSYRINVLALHLASIDCDFGPLRALCHAFGGMFQAVDLASPVLEQELNACISVLAQAHFAPYDVNLSFGRLGCCVRLSPPPRHFASVVSHVCAARETLTTSCRRSWAPATPGHKPYRWSDSYSVMRWSRRLCCHYTASQALHLTAVPTFEGSYCSLQCTGYTGLC